MSDQEAKYIGDSSAWGGTLDREIEVLRTLSTRTPREETSGLSVDIQPERQDRNDAVTGSSGVLDSSGTSFREMFREPVEPVRRQHTLGGISGRPKVSEVSSPIFTSVGKLPLATEYSVDRQQPLEVSESRGRCGERNQYFSTAGGASVGAEATLSQSRDLGQLGRHRSSLLGWEKCLSDGRAAFKM